MRKKNDKNKNNMKEAKWTEQEDQKLIDSCEVCSKITRVKRYCGKKNLIRRRNFGVDEEDLIIKLHALLGDRWSLIAGRLPGRTENEVNKYWNSHVRRKLKTAGINPNNHRVDQTLIITSSSPTTYKNPNCIYEDNIILSHWSR
ncbi:hypothetical protein ABFS83_08G066700 [Erythranthe nasuta]